MNLKFTSEELVRFYSRTRASWDEFYPSERWVLERIAGSAMNVLDVGCAAGGLGRALHERFSIQSYCGLDICEPLVKAALEASFPMPSTFYCEDILNGECLNGRKFDLVCALGCADFNLLPEPIVRACWEHVASDGWLVLSLRLTPRSGINDFARSFQCIRFEPGEPAGTEERANYVVFNTVDALRLLHELSPGSVLGYGYWGRPSSSAVTPYDRLVFTVFAVRKSKFKAQAELHLPLDCWLDVADSAG